MIKIKEPQTKEEFDSYYDLRWRIMRKPWNQPPGSEKDEFEDQSIHLMAYEGEQLLGVARAHFASPQEAQIRFVAVEEHSRRTGIGSKLIEELEKRIIQQGGKKIVLDSRKNAVSFYEEHDYEIVAKSHTLYDTIEHFKMTKDLQPDGMTP